MGRSKLPGPPGRLKDDHAAEYSCHVHASEEGEGLATVVTPTQSNDTDDSLAESRLSEYLKDFLAAPLLTKHEIHEDAVTASIVGLRTPIRLPPRIGNAGTIDYDILDATDEEGSLGDGALLDFLWSDDDNYEPSGSATTKTNQHQETAQVGEGNIAEQEEGVITTEPDLGYTDTDVLCGRGEFINRHPGNVFFREQKAYFQRRYLQAEKRKEKAAIAQALVNFMEREHGSRFLAREMENEPWYTVDKKRVLEKCKQLLREDLTPEDRQEKRKKYAAAKKRSKQL
jgi:hypothetical protein